LLSKRYYDETEAPPRPEALSSAIEQLEARAQHDAPEREVYLRVASHDGKLYLDLADKEWRAIEIGERGWNVIEDPPVRFRRPRGMQSLPMPKPGGSIDTLRQFVNVRADEDFVLVVACLLAALRHPGPYPVVVLIGEQGSAKTTVASMLRLLVDPNAVPLRAPPREERDLIAAAKNGHILAYDNMSGLPDWMSDSLCRLYSGAGHAARRLYTNDDEVLFKAQRPIILNGIENLVARQDLADRSICIALEPIRRDRRLSEQALWSKFEDRRPLLLGALLDIMVYGLRRLPEIRPKELPRMADFMMWAMAWEGALWPGGTVERAFYRNRAEAIENAIQADPIACAVIDLTKQRTMRTMRTTISPVDLADGVCWEGTATDLLHDLNSIVDDKIPKDRNWPKNVQSLSNRLRRAAPFLRERGIILEHTKRGHERARIIQIIAEVVGAREGRCSEADAFLEEDSVTPVDEPAVFPGTSCNSSSAPSASSAPEEQDCRYVSDPPKPDEGNNTKNSPGSNSSSPTNSLPETSPSKPPTMEIASGSTPLRRGPVVLKSKLKKPG
jgi:hypothetical protein